MGVNIIDKLKGDFKGKKVLVVGLGLQGGGIGLVNFFAKLGAKVKVTDLKTKDQLKSSLDQISNLDIEFTLGYHDDKDFIEAEYIFKGPSVRWDLPQLVLAQNKGIPVDMEASFFAAHCPAKIIGITGTRGKTTTTMMIYEVLKKNNIAVYLGGNIPQISTISLLEKITQDDWVILELSSWQLSGFHKRELSPHVAVITNLYPDHLNYYNSMDGYFFDKRAVYLFQKNDDYLIANSQLKSRVQKDNPISQVIYFSSFDFPKNLLNLKGVHNLENAAAALCVAKVLGIDKQSAVNSIADFKGLPYRQEIVGKKEQVIFVNDTTSTTPTATIKAIETFYENPIVILLGGNDKKLPYLELIESLKNVNKIILLKGSFTDQITPVVRSKYDNKILGVYDDLEGATVAGFIEAKKLTTKDQSVFLLFSPGATSFAMFNNEFHRGNEFNKVVKKILKNG